MRDDRCPGIADDRVSAAHTGVHPPQLRPLHRDRAAEQRTGIGFGVDDRLSWGLNFRYFQADFEKQEVIAEFDSAGINFEQIQVELRFETTILSAMLNLDYEAPFGRNSPFTLRASAGMGWEMIWNEENNFVSQISRSRFFNGFGWQLSGGLGVQISRSGILYVEGLYNDATATRTDPPVDGLPTFSRIDVSGVGILVGVKIVNLLKF